MAHSEVKFKYVSKCKVCRIQKKDQELFNYLHTLRFRDNASLEHIASVAANKFIEKGITLDPPNPMNLSTHFKRHTPLDMAAKYRAQNEIGITGNNTKGITEESHQHFDEIVKEKVDSYDELEQIYEGMYARFEAFDGANQGTITLQNLNGYVSFVRELRSLLVEMNKMEQDEELALLVLNTALQQYTVSTLHGFLQDLDAHKSDLRYYIKDADSVESGEDRYSPPVFDKIKDLLLTDMGRCGGVGLKIHPDFSYVNLYYWLLRDTHWIKRNCGIPLPIKGHQYYRNPNIP